MPLISGIFAQFQTLDQIPLEDVNKWLKVKIEPHVLQNYIGNRLLYPQSVSQTAQEVEIDFAILREILKKRPELLYKRGSKKLFIPLEFIERFPPPEKLLLTLMEVIIFPSNTEIILNKQMGNEYLGTIMNFDNNFPKNTEINITADNRVYKCLVGSITTIPVNKRSVKFQFDGAEPLLIKGGPLGIIVDLR